MAAPDNAFDWRDALSETYAEFSRQLIEHFPQLLGALLLLIVGWVGAYLLQLAVRKLLGGVDSIFKRFARADTAGHVRWRRSYTEIVGRVVFWTVLVFFMAAAAKMLGWGLFSGWLDAFITYLPNLFGGLLIILAGVLVGSAVYPAASGAAASAGVQHGEMLARGAQIAVVFTAVVIGVDQVGINIGFLTTLMAVIAGVLTAGGALAFALGARAYVANVIGVQFARRHFHIGERIAVGSLEGELLEITQTAILLDTDRGRAAVPGKLLHEQVSLVRKPGPDEAPMDEA